MPKQRFEQIALLDIGSLLPDDVAHIQSLSRRELLQKKHFPTLEQEVATFTKNIDCLLVSRNIRVGRDMLQQFSHLKFIGVYGTGIEDIDVDAARENHIQVSGIDDYCNHETAEFVLAQLLFFLRGLGEKKWKTEAQTLAGLHVGIIGMGRVGKALSALSQACGAQVVYTRKDGPVQSVNDEAKFLKLHAFLKFSDIISFHVPDGQKIFGQAEFDQLKADTILVNTCRGTVWDKKAFLRWIHRPHSFAIFDAVAGRGYETLASMSNVICSNQPAYLTEQSRIQRSRLFVQMVSQHAQSLAEKVA